MPVPEEQAAGSPSGLLLQEPCLHGTYPQQTVQTPGLRMRYLHSASVSQTLRMTQTSLGPSYDGDGDGDGSGWMHRKDCEGAL